MKIQMSAKIKTLAINGSPQNIPADQTIDLEFSAIDTGGGFKDPILDFSFTIPIDVVGSVDDEQKSDITLMLSDPDKEGNQVSFSYEGQLQTSEGENFEINGRLKEEQLSGGVIDFVFRLLR